MKNLNKLALTIMIALLFNSCGPKGLKVDNEEMLKITQRDSKVFKGSDGDIELFVGDITLGKTIIKVKSTSEDKLYLDTEMGEGDEAYFKYAENLFYKVRIKNFENHIFHDDTAFLVVSEASPELAKDKVQEIGSTKQTKISGDEIRAMFDKVNTSGLSFIRNGEVYSDSVMATHLENKFLINQEDIKSKEDFFRKIISKSMTSGESYKVIVKEDTVLLEDWIKE